MKSFQMHGGEARNGQILMMKGIAQSTAYVDLLVVIINVNGFKPG